jgi:hypothetical protein
MRKTKGRAKKSGKLNLNKSAVRRLDDKGLEDANGGRIASGLMCEIDKALSNGASNCNCTLTIYQNHNQGLRRR